MTLEEDLDYLIERDKKEKRSKLNKAGQHAQFLKDLIRLKTL